MDDIKAVIISNREIAKDTYEMVLGCRDGGHGITRPGQFVNIKIDGFYLRRPISVCDWTEDELTIIYKVVGSGTRIMSRYDSGRELDMLTPLGNGFDIGRIKGDMPVIIGGGAGVPPMYGLYRRLKEKGTDAKIVLGFGSVAPVLEAYGAEAVAYHVGVYVVVCVEYGRGVGIPGVVEVELGEARSVKLAGEQRLGGSESHEHQIAHQTLLDLNIHACGSVAVSGDVDDIIAVGKSLEEELTIGGSGE